MKLRVRHLRQSRGLTIEHLAQMAGISKGFLSQIETDKRQPSAETLEALAEALDCSVSYLFADSETEADALLQDLMTLDRDQRAAIRALILSFRSPPQD
jgi:transcriptional regulator with XRE-family HTH domain